MSEETLALDAIAEVGPGGDFSSHSHTLRHLRELWTSRTFGRETWDAWEEAGRPDPRDRAREEVRRILADHRPEPLPEDVDRELVKIIEARTAEERSTSLRGCRAQRNGRVAEASARCDSVR